MDVFALRSRLVEEYRAYISSFIAIRDTHIRDVVHDALTEGLLWPEALLQLNPSFEPGAWIDELVAAGVLHDTCRTIFRKDKDTPDTTAGGRPLRLHLHQEQAIRVARGGHNYVLTTGTGSGKSLAYIVPIVDFTLRQGTGGGIKAIIVYPMNALANSQYGELEKFLCSGFAEGAAPVTFARYTGQENDEARSRIWSNPPDILLTNYVMLELIMTRREERPLIAAAQGLRFLVLDELHTYRGRQGADVALLVRRVRERLQADQLQCVGTSATMASGGTYDEQRAEVARVASRLFGATVQPDHVIGETLQRLTPERGFDEPGFGQILATRVNQPHVVPQTFEAFVTDPLAGWIETTFGVTTEAASGRLIRSEPRSIAGHHGAASELSAHTGIDAALCEQAIQQALLGGYQVVNPASGFPAFAFRLHQFISRGDTVYASLEAEAGRYCTVEGQQFVPGDRNRVLFPLAFCRECGQEYYIVERTSNSVDGQTLFVPRAFQEIPEDEGDLAGYLYLSSTNPWPDDRESQLERVPDDWTEEHRGTTRIRSSRRKYLPEPFMVDSDGRLADTGTPTWYIPAPFRFCLCCGVAYGGRQTSDFAKLATLNSGGRSTATTVLSLSAARELRASDLPQRARKLLSFTDNRQDAALQAGHFNDFVEIGVLRAALYRAALQAGSEGLRHDELTQRVFDALSIPFDSYAANPAARFQARNDTERALREVLGYRIYRDLQRGWRITSPNLEQCGLLDIHYASLDEVCAAEDIWEQCHSALVTASPQIREAICKVLLDLLRRDLAVRVDYLDDRYQERLLQASSQYLLGAWALDENERLEHATVVFPRPSTPQDYGGHVFLSPRGGFGQYLRRSSTFPEFHERLRLSDTEVLIRQLLAALLEAGLVTVVAPARSDDDVAGYQVVAAAMRWVAGDGSRSFRDPIRMPRESDERREANAFFLRFYREVAASLHGLEAAEHTAQVPAEERQQREDRFKEATLPILYCSPTMELGVDIAQLNVVNMRNVPPTPANYAQRSGRAGRSGQPALVYTYCTTGSSHDQYFFRRPDRMVAGAVTPPRLELANQDLLRAHIHAIWLAESGMSLGKSLSELLDVDGDEPSLVLRDHIRADVDDPVVRRRTHERAQAVLASIQADLNQSNWFREDWLDRVLARIPQEFDKVCERWRGLYRSALHQARAQDTIIRDASRSHGDKEQATRLRREAEDQLRLLTEIDNLAQSDFYSYRYFASEGFLPGYNFPRLPLSAFIPARRQRQQHEFLSRPRFLAISEFGPRAIVYHEGSRYTINKVILPVDSDQPLTQSAKRCEQCGYLHPIVEGDGLDVCERCGAALDRPYRNLFRLQNVSTRRRDRINSDEEERMRLGYELISGVRFDETGDYAVPVRRARVMLDNLALAKLSYGQTARIWRINLGWARRRNRHEYGFVLDTERGYWAKNQAEAGDPDDPLSQRTARVIPYVEDYRNCLLFEPELRLSEAEMASLQAALKSAIQVTFQLEDNELAAEPLPSRDMRRVLLLYESAEGGAGVLSRLVDEPDALNRVARQALQICHFNPDTGADLRQAPRAREACEAACYDCLMTYGNQRDHLLLDRQSIRQVLLDLANAQLLIASGPSTREEQRARLDRLAGSDLERRWLDFLDEHNLRLPSDAQVLMETCSTRPDFVYREHMTVIYIDGPHHEYPERARRDQAQSECLVDLGYTVLRFGHSDDWYATVRQFPYVFGLEG